MLPILGLPNWIILLAVFAAGAGSGTWATAEIYTGRIAKIELAQARALDVAKETARIEQAAADKAAMDAAQADAAGQVKIVTQTKTIVKEIPRYVPDTSACITVGLIRVLDAAALGADPADLALAPGEFDETCAGIGAHALAESVAENYGRARGDAEQLSNLQDYVRRVQAALASTRQPPEPPGS